MKNKSSRGENDIEGVPDKQSGTPSSVRNITRENIEAIALLEDVASAKRSRADKAADHISKFVGSMLFVYLHLFWFATWVICNSAAIVPKEFHFDPYPYTFLTFVVSLEAIFLSTFILISQNHEELLARRRNHLDLQINLLSEQENSKILQMLTAIERRLEIDADSEACRLEEAVRPEEVVAQIQDVIESAADATTKR